MAASDDIRHTDPEALILAKMARNLLPRERPAKMWGGFGSGYRCDGCEQPITQEQREYEFDPPGWRTIRLHAECLQLWHAARMASDRGPSPGASEARLDTWGAQLAAVLRNSSPSGYCVDCLATKLDLPPSEVRNAAQLLVARPGFRVVERACYTCGHVKDSVVVFAPRDPAAQ